MTREQNIEELSKNISALPLIIKPNFCSTTKCAIPVCVSTSLIQKNHPGLVKQNPVGGKEFALSKNKYESSDFVSIDLFTIKTTGLLPRGYEQEVPNSNSYGGIIYNDAAYGYILIENHVSLGAGKQSWEI